MRLPKNAATPVVCLTLVVVFLLLSSFSAFMATAHRQRADADAEGVSGSASRYAHRTTLYDVHPGDWVEFGTPWVGSFDPAGPYVRVLVVEGGEGDAYLTGGEAAHVLLETQYAKAETYRGHPLPGDYAPLQVRFHRPDIYAGKPHEPGLNGDYHDAVDLVFVYDRPVGMSFATWTETRSGLSQMVYQLDHEVARGGWVAAQYVWIPLLALSAIATVVTTITWWLARRRSDPPPADLGGLVEIQQQLLQYMQRLRMVLLGTGALVLFGGITAVAALDNMPVEFEPWRGWGEFRFYAGLVILAAGITLWAMQYRSLSRELRRWRHTPPPFDA